MKISGADIQDPLVSGTNIKTINGSSVLGSGDLTISGLGGVQGLIAIPGQNMPLISFGSTFGSAMIANRILMYAFIPAQNITVSALNINVTSAVASSNARILIYSNASGTYRPNTRILETTNLDCSTTGVKSFSYSATFTKGVVYWIGTYSNSTPSVSHYQANQLPGLRQDAGNFEVHIEGSYTFGQAPSTYPTPIGYNNRACPAVSLTIV